MDAPTDASSELLVHEVGRFKLHYSLRTPVSGRSCGLGGVDRFQLVRCYADALDSAYRYFLEHHWNEPVFTGPDDRIEVFVGYHENPGVHHHMDGSNRGLPTIHLMSELQETYAPAAVFDRARAEATHEAAHVFTDVYLGQKASPADVTNEMERYWYWFNEATAAYFERSLNRGNIATLRYYHTMMWVNHPEITPEVSAGYLGDGRTPWYSYSPWLLMGLVDLTGDEDLIRKVWHNAAEKQKPRDVLEKILLEEHGWTMGEAVHKCAVRSYRTRRLDRQAFLRYGNRKFAYVFRVDPDRPCEQTWACSVGPLACRYYKVGPTRGLRRLRVEVRPDDPAALRSLRATLHGLRHPGAGWPRPLLELQRDHRDGAMVYDGTAAGIPGGCLVLVVSCDEECSAWAGNYSHPGHGYELRVVHS